LILDGTVTGDGDRVGARGGGGGRGGRKREAQGDGARADPGAAWKFRLAISP
jgi:hypothetical protein